jgi:uncharacterized protein YhdP
MTPSARHAVIFTPWFLFPGVGVLSGNASKPSLSGKSRLVRAAARLTYAGVFPAITLAIRHFTS